ncbi:hypothetical protein SDC9_83629 [bioreactor metagenome]|uniref:Uncharacterized protein n=1 Tax=bioreactor metagenome TaxID=1076179 RepID=A0A644ZGQ6_9ZZZZ
MVAFVDDDLAILIQKTRQILTAGEGLHDGNVNHTGGLFFAASDNPNTSFFKLKKGFQPPLPLPQEFRAMNKNQSTDPPPGDQGRGSDCLTESRRCAEDTDFIFEHLPHR